MTFHFVSTGSEACFICARGFLRVAGKAASQASGGAQSALCGAGSRGDAEDYSALQQLQHTGEETKAQSHTVQETYKTAVILIIIVCHCRSC